MLACILHFRFSLSTARNAAALADTGLSSRRRTFHIRYAERVMICEHAAQAAIARHTGFLLLHLQRYAARQAAREASRAGFRRLANTYHDDDAHARRDFGCWTSFTITEVFSSRTTQCRCASTISLLRIEMKISSTIEKCRASRMPQVLKRK